MESFDDQKESPIVHVDAIVAMQPSPVRDALVRSCLIMTEGTLDGRMTPRTALLSLNHILKRKAFRPRFPLPEPVGTTIRLTRHDIHDLSEDEAERIVAAVMPPTAHPSEIFSERKTYLGTKSGLEIKCPRDIAQAIIRRRAERDAEDRFVSDFLDSLIEESAWELSASDIDERLNQELSDIVLNLDGNPLSGSENPAVDANVKAPTDLDFAEAPGNSAASDTFQPLERIVPTDPTISDPIEMPARGGDDPFASFNPPRMKDTFLSARSLDHQRVALYPDGEWFHDFCDFVSTLNPPSGDARGDLTRAKMGGEVSIAIRGRERKSLLCTVTPPGRRKALQIEIAVTPEILPSQTEQSVASETREAYDIALSAIDERRPLIAQHVAVKLLAAANASVQGAKRILSSRSLSALQANIAEYVAEKSGYEDNPLKRVIELDGRHYTIAVLPRRRIAIAVAPYTVANFHVDWDNKVAHNLRYQVQERETLANRLIEKLLAAEPDILELAEWRGFLNSVRSALTDGAEWKRRAERFLASCSKLETWLASTKPDIEKDFTFGSD